MPQRRNTTAAIPQTPVPAGPVPAPARAKINSDIEDKAERAERAQFFKAKRELPNLVRLKQEGEKGSSTGVSGMVIDIVARVYSTYSIGHNPNFIGSGMSTISRNNDETWTATRPNGETWTPGTEGAKKFIYVVMANGEIRIAPFAGKDNDGHPILASNAAYVRDAGEVDFDENGRFVERNGDSGSYCAPRDWDRKEFHLDYPPQR